jgi:hypothetical protein
VKGFSNVGQIRGTGSLEVSAREFTNATSRTKQYGAAVEVREAGRLERRSTSYIDEDELDALIKGIDYISKIEKSVTKLRDFEAIYSTRGDLRVVVFSNSDGKLSAAITSGRIGAASTFIEMPQLAEFRGLILKAQDTIRAARQ